jgi:hypothetical protein
LVFTVTAAMSRKDINNVMVGRGALLPLRPISLWFT